MFLQFLYTYELESGVPSLLNIQVIKGSRQHIYNETSKRTTNQSEGKNMTISESDQTVQELCTMGEAMRILGFRFQEVDKFKRLGLQPVAKVYGDGRSHWRAYDLNEVRGALFGRRLA